MGFFVIVILNTFMSFLLIFILKEWTFYLVCLSVAATSFETQNDFSRNILG